MTDSQAENFWERNVAFMTEKSKKVQKMGEKFNKELTFKPNILPKSREMSKGSLSCSRSQVRSKPWLNDRMSASKDSL